LSRCLLGTNIISNVTKPVPSEALVAWMAGQGDADLFISSLAIAEIRGGILEKPAGKKRRELERWFSGLRDLRRHSRAGCCRSTKGLASSGRV
jgi:toxin FitB